MADKQKSLEEAAQRVLDGDEEEGEKLLLDAPSGMGNTPMEVAKRILDKRKAKRNERAETPPPLKVKYNDFEDFKSLSSEPTSIQDKLDDRQESARIQTQSDMALQQSKEQMQNSFSSPEQVQEQSDARAKQKQQMQMEFDRLLSEMLKDDISEEERKRLEMQAKKLQNDASEMLFELE
tara:strand:+ start:479 stop:1015 length:537 start_codon:yes stop_codon:yes gene_type:complete